MPEAGRADRLRLALLSRSVCPLHGHGGLERHVSDLLRHLSAAGVEVTLVTRPPQPGVKLQGIVPDASVRQLTVPYRTFPFAGRRGTTILDRSTAYLVFGYRAGRAAAVLSSAGQVDIVHALGAAGLGYAVGRRRQEGTVPFVFNPQGLEEFGGIDGTYAGQPAKRLGYGPLRWAVRRCADAADCVIATDRAIAPAVARHLGVGEDRIRLVPNAVDVAACEALAGPADGARTRAGRGIGAKETVLLSVGRLERNKGFHVLARALGSLRPQRWRWVLVGDGPFRNDITRAVAEAGIASRTALVGRVDDRQLHAWYEAATVFVHPTLYEGSSLVTLEAMVHRRPVIATTAGGLPDKVHDGETGWLVAPGSPDALAGALARALAAPERLPDLGAAGRALAEAEFSWTVVIRRQLDVYGELMALRPGARR
ncbi:MAG: glycosyltransferase family 4 protein [Acidobacteriota bacterium]